MENVYWGYVCIGLESDEEEATLLEQFYKTKESAENAAQKRFDDMLDNENMHDWEEFSQCGYIIQFSYNEETGGVEKLQSHDHVLYYQREPSMESQHGLTLSDLV